MKKITLLFILLATISLSSCKSKYPNLEDGLYAELITNKGTFVAKLYHEATPLTVANFVELAEGTNEMVDSVFKGKPFYNGLTFHRVMENFMIQGGDHKADGTGSPGYRFPDEIVDSLKHDRKGLLSMANGGPATNGSQFFITLKDTPWLDGIHTIFGEIVIGQEVVDSIGSVPVAKPSNKPLEDVVIQEVNIINKGTKVPSFTAEMELIEQKRKEKEERLAKVAEETINGLNALQEQAEELPSGLKLYWNKRSKGMVPEEGSGVLMNYAGYFTDGRLLDTSHLAIAEAYDMVDTQRLAMDKYGPLPTTYSKDARLIPGFREGLLQMAIGDKVTLFIPSHLAYGEQGAPRGGIPPNTDLIFELELVGLDEGK